MDGVRTLDPRGGDTKVYGQTSGLLHDSCTYKATPSRRLLRNAPFSRTPSLLRGIPRNSGSIQAIECLLSRPIMY